MDIDAPLAPGLDLVLGGDDVAEPDAGEAVQTCVGLLVDLTLAVGVGRDLGLGAAHRWDGGAEKGLFCVSSCCAEGDGGCAEGAEEGGGLWLGEEAAERPEGDGGRHDWRRV